MNENDRDISHGEEEDIKQEENEVLEWVPCEVRIERSCSPGVLLLSYRIKSILGFSQRRFNENEVNFCAITHLVPNCMSFFYGALRSSNEKLKPKYALLDDEKTIN